MANAAIGNYLPSICKSSTWAPGAFKENVPKPQRQTLGRSSSSPRKTPSRCTRWTFKKLSALPRTKKRTLARPTSSKDVGCQGLVSRLTRTDGSGEFFKQVLLGRNLKRRKRGGGRNKDITKYPTRSRAQTAWLLESSMQTRHSLAEQIVSARELFISDSVFFLIIITSNPTNYLSAWTRRAPVTHMIIPKHKPSKSKHHSLYLSLLESNSSTYPKILFSNILYPFAFTREDGFQLELSRSRAFFCLRNGHGSGAMLLVHMGGCQYLKAFLGVMIRP